MHDGIWIIFLDQSGRQIPFWYYVKYWDSFLTYWHPMTSILSQQKRASNGKNSNAFNSKLKNIFSIFSCISEISIKLGILWNRRWSLEVICFWNFRFHKAGSLKCLKKILKSNQLKKFCFSSFWNLQTVF